MRKRPVAVDWALPKSQFESVKAAGDAGTGQAPPTAGIVAAPAADADDAHGAAAGPDTDGAAANAAADAAPAAPTTADHAAADQAAADGVGQPEGGDDVAQDAEAERRMLRSVLDSLLHHVRACTPMATRPMCSGLQES